MIVAHVLAWSVCPPPRPSARVILPTTYSHLYSLEQGTIVWVPDNGFIFHPPRHVHTSTCNRFSCSFNGPFLLFLNNLTLTACISVDVHTSGWIQETAVQHRCSCYWQDRPHEGNSHSTSPYIVGARGNVTVHNNHTADSELVCCTLL